MTIIPVGQLGYC